jgi:uncharacterized protein YqhQ
VKKEKLYTLSIGLVLASIVLSILFKGLFVFLLIPAFFAWNKGRDDSG